MDAIPGLEALLQQAQAQGAKAGDRKKYRLTIEIDAGPSHVDAFRGMVDSALHKIGGAAHGMPADVLRGITLEIDKHSEEIVDLAIILSSLNTTSQSLHQYVTLTHANLQRSAFDHMPLPLPLMLGGDASIILTDLTRS